MEDTAYRAIAIVGLGGILPDAPSAPAFWENLKQGRYSISDVTPDRWDPALYYDPDPKAPDKSYSKIGGFARAYDWDPAQWKLPVPPRVAAAMDETQKWAVSATRAALLSYGWPERPLDSERTAVILGNAMAGEMHYRTVLRISYPEIARELGTVPSFAALPADVRKKVAAELRTSVAEDYPEITEDTMPGELANCMAGRIANLFNFHGPNFVCDAACASALAAISAAVEGLVQRDFDAAIAGGVDRNMGASTYVKFCKIGALSATGTRPYAHGADGFVMGEGAALFLLRRLEDAERDGDRVLAVLRGIGASSDGKGKGITAPNPLGQKLAVERAWKNAGLPPGTASLVEGHGTSTRVGDVVEVGSLTEAFGRDVPARSIPLGSVKSNVGHLKGAAGAAGLLKTVFALDEKVLPPSLNFDAPNPNIDFEHAPFYVNTELKDWPAPACGVRRAGLSAFGFGGTNFHAVLEEYVPGRLRTNGRSTVAVSRPQAGDAGGSGAAGATLKAPLRGALVLGSTSEAELVDRLRQVQEEAARGKAPLPSAPCEADLRATERLALDFEDASDLAEKAAKVRKAFESGNSAAWRALRPQGIFRGTGPAPKVAFLYTGQGSQYVNMLRSLRGDEPVVEETFAEADRVMTPLLGRPLSEYVFVDAADAEAVAGAEEALKQTAVTQPAVLAADIALTRLLAAYGIAPDMVMGHSLGEYGALVVAGVLPFADALEAVSARGREMTRVSLEDNGKMAAVMAPLEDIERLLAGIDGYLVIANYNSRQQAVIGGTSAAVEEAVAAFTKAGFQAVLLPVSHAFHTRIVAPASEPLRRTLERLHIEPPRVPVVANVTGDFYPMDPGARPRILEVLGQQVASPVQFVKGLETLRTAGVTLFIEVGPKRALQGFVDDVLGNDTSVASLFTNHPKLGDAVAFNQALCGLYAAGLGVGTAREQTVASPVQSAKAPESAVSSVVRTRTTEIPRPRAESLPPDRYQELGRLFAEFLERGLSVYDGRPSPEGRFDEPVVITGCGLGLPGLASVFDDSNTGRLLRGEQLIDAVPAGVRQGMANKHIVRLVKSEVGESRFESIDDVAEVIKLAGRAGELDLEKQFGVSAERIPALDVVTKLAIGVGLEALRDAGIPLVMRYKTTTRGTSLPERWVLPDALRDDTGVIFASAFPGLDSFATDLTRYHLDRTRREQLALLKDLRSRLDGSTTALAEVDRRIRETETLLGRDGFVFDRRFLFRILSMGHSQFAEHIGARGPNTQINAACASTTQAVGLAEDWIRAGRCRRVIVVSADDATSDLLMEWIGAGFLASGAAATDERVEDAALPFDRRRHGMVVGMGAAALVVESASAARERGLSPICDVLSAVTANSAFHGTRLDVQHISEVMETLVAQAESRHGVRRDDMAPETVFVSHETYTPARGGSASAEVHALRRVFGSDADRIVMANTKGFTGHAMAVGIEDVVAVRALETGLVPPVANFKEVDPELGTLNLSRGGQYPVRYALRLGAGFGSQVSMALLRWVEPPDGRRRSPDQLGFSNRIADPVAFKAWLGRLSGQDAPELEVERRTLRVKDQGPAAPSILAASAAAIPMPAVPTRAPAVDSVKERILALVSAKTGYPKDMLALDLDLESDLGIDTVKQAELFASVREEWSIPRDENRKLRDYPTLNHVIAFVHKMRPDLETAAPEAAPAVVPVRETPTVPIAAPPAASLNDPVQEAILALVTEKTGYPPDMLDLDLDLEADLGIDTVKQAELFASVRGRWDIPRDENRKLRDYPTLRHVVDFVHQMRPDLTAPVAEKPATATAAASATASTSGATVRRRVAVPVVRPPLSLCKPTAVNLGAESRVLVMCDRGGVGKALGRRLEKLGCEVLLVEDSPPAETLVQRIEEWTAEKPIQGVYWLPALDVEGDLAAMSLGDWREGLRVRVKLLYATMRALAERMTAKGAFLVTGTRLGGQHGYDEAGAVAPLGGAVTGFTKAWKRERPDALVKAVDFEASRKTAEFAELLLEETGRDPGVVEVGYKDGLRFSVGLEERGAADGHPGLTLGKESVLVVTGAAGAIVSAITADLAAASGGTFHLFDLVPEPDPANPDLARFRADKDGLKRDIFDRLKARGERATPALVEKEMMGLERALAALAAIDAVKRAGGRAFWYACDLRDGEAVKKACAIVGERSPRVDALLHGAGLEISRFLKDKEPREFDLVFDVKADGWFNLLQGLGGIPIGATVAFSSIAGRFGNGGQTDYSAANDLLCKTTSSFHTTRPATRGLAIDWTAWADIGMASRGSIPQMMERAGIDMLPAASGIPVIRRELTAGASGELVIAGRLGVMAEEWDETGGLDPAAVAARGPLVGAVRGFGLHEGLCIETVLDPKEQPYLDHHRIEGTPVLPGVMGIESFAEAAALVLPGFKVVEVEGIDFHAPFKFYRDEPRSITVNAVLRPVGDTIVADCRLTGTRSLPGQAAPQVTLHFTARVCLSRGPRREEADETSPAAGERELGPDDIYRVYFHGPAYRVVEKAWRSNGEAVGLFSASLPPDHEPSAGATLVGPRLIELCFQTAGLLEMGTRGTMGLPHHVERVRLLREPTEKGRLFALVRPKGAGFEARVVDEDGHVYLVLEDYRTVELPAPLDEKGLESFRNVMSQGAQSQH